MAYLNSPFVHYTVFLRLSHRVKGVENIKKLRKLSIDCNKLFTKKLEEEASKGQLQIIDLTFSGKSKEEVQEQLNNFIEETSQVPQLFTRFSMHFPDTLKLSNVTTLLTSGSYCIKQLRLTIPVDINLDGPNETLLRNFLGCLAPTLEKLSGNHLCPNMDTNDPLPALDLPHVNEDTEFPRLTMCHLGLIVRRISGEIRRKIFNNWRCVPNVNSLHVNSFHETVVSDLRGFLGGEDDIASGRWSTLTALNIAYVSADISSQLATTLLDLAGAGMKLNSFGIKFVPKIAELGEIFEKWTYFFQTQAATLESLYFHLLMFGKLNEAVEGGQNALMIKIPTFPKLWHLDLFIRNPWNSATRNFLAINSPNINFPNLSSLKINPQGLNSIYSNGGTLSNLYRLELVEWGNSFSTIKNAQIESVKVLTCQSLRVMRGIEKCQWISTIRKMILTIQGFRKPISLSRFKAMKTLVLNVEKPLANLQKFRNLLKMKSLSKVTFKGLEVDPNVQDAFRRTSPNLQINFK